MVLNFFMVWSLKDHTECSLEVWTPVCHHVRWPLSGLEEHQLSLLFGVPAGYCMYKRRVGSISLLCNIIHFKKVLHLSMIALSVSSIKQFYRTVALLSWIGKFDKIFFAFLWCIIQSLYIALTNSKPNKNFTALTIFFIATSPSDLAGAGEASFYKKASSQLNSSQLHT